MSWLKDVLTKTIKISGIEQVSRRALNFVAGDGIEITAEDDDAGKATVLTISATGEGGGGGGATAAEDVSYDNTESGIDATNVQAAIDELHADDNVLSNAISDNGLAIGVLDGRVDDAEIAIDTLESTSLTHGTRLDALEVGSSQSSDGKLTLDQIVASDQLTGTITTGNNADLVGPTDIVDGKYPIIAWTVLLTISGVDYRADYVAAYKRASGVTTVLSEHETFAAPPNVTITAVSLSDALAVVPYTEQPGINIANATGADLTYYVHHSTARQTK